MILQLIRPSHLNSVTHTYVYSYSSTMFNIVFIVSLAISSVLAEHITLSFQPSPPDNYSSLIWFNKTSYDVWSNQLDNYIEVYRTPDLTPGRAENLKQCDYFTRPEGNKVCDINVESFSPCVVTNYFGYRKKSPCVFIEFEKIMNWKPKYFKDMYMLPKTMPKSLKSYINERSSEPNIWETLWLSCEGETPADKEFVGPIRYVPGPGFPGYFFPYTGQEGYLNPIIAVQFEMPATGLIINVECKVWAANIYHGSEETVGTVKFQLMID